MSAYLCSVSGNAVKSLPPTLAEGELDDMPVGMARVTVEIRSVNPRYAVLQNARKMMIEQQMAALPDDAEHREEARPTLEVIADAYFAAVAAETPRYLTETHEVYVSAEHLPTLASTLGLGAADEDEDEDDEEEEADET